jgi:hypothetical protein
MWVGGGGSGRGGAGSCGARRWWGKGRRISRGGGGRGGRWVAAAGAPVMDLLVGLELPPRAKLHDVFHVGLLKKWVGDPPAAPPPLPNIHHGVVDLAPE